MRLTRIKTTVMAGVMAASMLLPNMTAMAEVPHATSGAEITKKVTAAAAGVTFNETFTYTFEQEGEKDDSGVKANVNTAGINSIEIDVTDSTTDRTNTGSIDLSKLTTPGVYTYIVEESARTATDDPAGTTWKYDETRYRLRVYVSNGDEGLTKTMTLVKLDADGKETEAKLTTAEFVNTLTKTSDPDDDTKGLFSLTKEVKDNSGIEPAGTKYTFTVTIDRDTNNPAPQSGYKYTVDGTEYTLAADGEVELEAGQTAIFTNIYAGDKVSVTEADVTNVKSTKVSTKVGTADATETNGKTVSNVLIDEDGTNATYTNTWEDVTETGVVTTIAPYVTLVVVAVATVAAYMAIKGRVAR